MMQDQKISPDTFVDVLKFLKRKDISEARLVARYWDDLIVGFSSKLPLDPITVSFNEFGEVFLSKISTPSLENSHDADKNSTQVYVDQVYPFLKNAYVQKLFVFTEFSQSSLDDTLDILRKMTKDLKKSLRVGTFKPFSIIHNSRLPQLHSLETMFQHYIQADQVLLTFKNRQIIKEPHWLPVKFMPKEINMGFGFPQIGINIHGEMIRVSEKMKSRDFINFIKFHSHKDGFNIKNYDQQPRGFYEKIHNFVGNPDEKVPSFKMEFISNHVAVCLAVRWYYIQVPGVNGQQRHENRFGYEHEEVLYKMKCPNGVFTCTIAHYKRPNVINDTSGVITYEYIAN